MKSIIIAAGCGVHYIWAMKQALLLVCIGVMSVSLASCGAHNWNASRNCSEQIQTDYMNVDSACFTPNSMACQKAAEAFLQNHPAVNCSAPNWLSGKTMQINGDNVRATLQNSRICSNEVEKGYDLVVRSCKRHDGAFQKYTCRLAVKNFLHYFSDVNCQINDSAGNAKTVDEESIREIGQKYGRASGPSRQLRSRARP